MNHDNLLHRMKRLIWDPMDPWLFYAMLTIYVMSLFLLYVMSRFRLFCGQICAN